MDQSPPLTSGKLCITPEPGLHRTSKVLHLADGTQRRPTEYQTEERDCR